MKKIAIALTCGTLLLFTLRRWLFILFALRSQPQNTQPADTPQPIPTVLLLVPVRNEADALPDLLAALQSLIYPPDKLTIVFVDDGSTDNSSTVLQPWLAKHTHWHLLSLVQNVGKAEALNMALRNFSQGQLIAIYDADERPHPKALQYLVEPFMNPTVGGVSGRRAVLNDLASIPASYTAFEGLVHQLITMRAKDRLNLAPAILGANCIYRRAALDQAGQFRPNTLLEDSDLTVTLTRAGWQTCFVSNAISYHQVPETLSGYWKQHTRWARGFNEVAKEQTQSLLFNPQLSPFLRLELLLFSVGYVDRVALLATVFFAFVTKHRTRQAIIWTIILNLLTPFIQILVALTIIKAPRVLWSRIIWVPLFFGVDIAMAVSSLFNTLRQTPQLWEERKSRK